MAIFLTMVLSNAVLATFLALVAACVGRLCRRPALAHGLWLLVLIKLITPPLVPISVRAPEAVAATATTQSTEATAADDLVVVTTELSPAQSTEERDAPTLVAAPEAGVETTALLPFDWRLALLAVWLGGSLSWWGLALFRLCRFHRYLRFAGPAVPEMQFRIALLARRLGLRTVPEVLFTPGSISPLLWFWGGRPRLVVPEELWEKLTEPQRDALLIHELAHLRRGDHWVRLLELIVLGLYWWHPVVWWAQRELREAEEYCCDAWVVWALPGAAAIYAATLVETWTFLSRARGTLPLAASGIGAMPIARRRLTMILREAPPRMLSRTGLLALLVLGMLLLPFWPTWAQPPQPGGPAEDRAPAAEPFGFINMLRAGRDSGVKESSRNQPNQGEGARTPRATGDDLNTLFDIIANGKDSASRADITNPRLQAMFDHIAEGLGITNGQLTREQFISAMQQRTGQIHQWTNSVASNEEIESAQDEIELAKAHFQIQRAQLAVAEASLKVAAQQRDRLKKVGKLGGVSQEDLAEAENRVEAMGLQVEIKRAELREPEVRLRKAERRMGHIAHRSSPDPRGQNPAANSAPVDFLLFQLYEHWKSERLQPAANAEADRRNTPFDPASPTAATRPVERRPPPKAAVVKQTSPPPVSVPANYPADPTRSHLRDLDRKLEAVMTQVEALRREIQGIQRPRDADAPRP